MARRFLIKGVGRKLPWLAAIGCLLAPAVSLADSNVMPAQIRTIITRPAGYARVEPVAVLNLKALLAGIITGLHILPGEQVEAGTALARLEGPVVEALLAERQSAVTNARATLTAATKSLAVIRSNQEAHLNTVLDVYRAEASLADAQAHFDDAETRLRAARAAIVLRAPAAGTVLAVDAAEGQTVQPGQTILTLQPAGSLWLKAVFFGPDWSAVRPGMSGEFAPADGAAAIPVKVRTIFSAVQADGGRAVGLVAIAPTPPWQNGEAGMVTLQGVTRTLPAVPTRALVLDQGRWWVLLHTSSGNRRQEVVPGPTLGDETLLEKGIKPGSEVVVENAYLEFHQDFSRQYQPPD
ncbi:MAG: efflux RND transporter periplasmic adaptor subunit [Deltaproteobacteria bacterium]